MPSDKDHRLTSSDLRPQQDDVPGDWENRSRDILRNQLGEDAFLKVEASNFKDAVDELGFMGDIGDKFRRTKLDLFTCCTLPLDARKDFKGDPIPVGGCGLVKVVGNPAFPEHSFFQKGRLIPLRLRHNNLSFEDDALLDGRVTSIKFADKDQGGPFDLILHTGRTPQYHSADSFQEFVAAFRAGPDALRRWCMKASSNYFGRVENLRKAPESYYSLRYYNHVTYEFTSVDGATWLARFRLIPADGSTETGLLTAKEQENIWDIVRSDLPADYLRSEYTNRLQASAVQYRLQIQLLKDDVGEQLEADYDTVSSYSADTSESATYSGRNSVAEGALVHTDVTQTEHDGIFYSHYDQNEVFQSRTTPFGSDVRNPCVMWNPEVSPWLDFAIVTLTCKLLPQVLSSTSFNLGNQLWSCCPLSSKSTRDFSSLSLSVRGFHGINPDKRNRNDHVTESRTEYRITTVTGTLINAGTDADVSITITGSKGRTPPINLDQRFKDDFESGQRDDFLEEGPEVGEIVAIEMTLSSMFGNRRWYLEEVIVSDVKSDTMTYFPCYQWLTSRQPSVLLFRGEAVLPQLEAFPASYLLRKHELAIRRARYKWHKEQGLPGRIDVNKYEELPKEARFHMEHELNYYSKYLRTLANTGTGKLNTLLNTWDIFTDNPKLLTTFLKDKSLTKKVIQVWDSDEEFGRQMLNGPHPVRIQKVSRLPERLEPAADDIRKLMDRNITIDRAIDDGYFYMLRYPELDNLERCASYKGKYNRYITSPICLMYVNKDGKCLPLAINLEVGGPVWTPRDGAIEWKAAKMWLREADVQIHEVVSRHLQTQLVGEAVAIAMFRNLASSHPVYRLLYPHLKYALAVNVLGRQLLYPADDGLFERFLAVGGQHRRLARAGYRRFDVDQLHLPRDLSRRGVDDGRSLPSYWYRDDALAIWRAVSKYVGTVLRLSYRNDDGVRADDELQSWIADLAENGLPGQTTEPSGRVSGLAEEFDGLSGQSCGHSGLNGDHPGQTDDVADQTSGRYLNHGIPSELTCLDDVIDFVTMFVFSASAQHAALSSGMMDYYSFVPNAPSMMMMPPPTSKGETAPIYLKKALPTRGKTAEIIAAFYTLSRRGKYEEYLNSFKENYFDEEPIRQAQLAFIVDLERITESIQNRNESLDIPYTYLLPENIPKTVSI